MGNKKITPSLLNNLPGGPADKAVMKAAMTPEACVEEAFENLGKCFCVIAGEHSRQDRPRVRSIRTRGF